MKAFVAVTDGDWFRFLSTRDDLEEVNFWQPSGGRDFHSLSLGEPLLFKLHYPDHAIAGGGFFAHFTRLPVSLAWETFGVANGTRSFLEMRQRIEKYRRIEAEPREDYEIGCIVLEDPFFLPRDVWIPAPADFSKNIVTGKSYDLSTTAGRDLWDRVIGARAVTRHAGAEPPAEIEGPVYTTGPKAHIRLGQGAFRTMVTDAYLRRCAVSGEKALPVLQAAHIRPLSEGGAHRLDNGLLLRSDIHALFDKGYVTITPERRVRVSRRLKEDFDNGEPYYPFHDVEIHVPRREPEQPKREFLEWHADTVFRG